MSSSKIINNAISKKRQAKNKELKQLVRILNILVKCKKTNIAGTYLEVFLKHKKYNNLEDYLNN